MTREKLPEITKITTADGIDIVMEISEGSAKFEIATDVSNPDCQPYYFDFNENYFAIAMDIETLLRLLPTLTSLEIISMFNGYQLQDIKEA